MICTNPGCRCDARLPTLNLARDLLDCADAIESFANEIRRIAGRLSPNRTATGFDPVAAETSGCNRSEGSMP